jgi:hypothetical protein
MKARFAGTPSIGMGVVTDMQNLSGVQSQMRSG